MGMYAVRVCHHILKQKPEKLKLLSFIFNYISNMYTLPDGEQYCPTLRKYAINETVFYGRETCWKYKEGTVNVNNVFTLSNFWLMLTVISVCMYV